MTAGTKTQPLDSAYRLHIINDNGRVYLPAELRRRLFGGMTEGIVDARIEDGVLILTPVNEAEGRLTQ